MRILVVDDTESVRLVVSSLLRRWGHEVVTAADGEEAWELLCRDPVRLVVCDWMMPRLDGPGLCQRIRNAAFDHYIYLILLTSRDDKADIVEGMEAGADDFVTKPFSKDELNVRVKAALRILDLEERLGRRNQQLSEALDTVRADLEAAARTQLGLLPPTNTRYGDIRFDWLFSPSTYIGGDVLGYFLLDDDAVAFYCIDVAGHGVPSALMSVTLNKYITPDFCRNGSTRFLEPGRVVGALNKAFLNESDDSFYFTMLYGVFDAKQGRVSMCQAAHPHPILVPASGPVRELGDGGLPVAMLDFASYESSGFEFAPGDRLVMYSDGLTECGSASDEQYGTERLLRFLQDHRELDSESLLSALHRELETWNGDTTFDDDLSVLVATHV